jgi:predicted DNA-binding transcriptional regulator AlpA
MAQIIDRQGVSGIADSIMATRVRRPSATDERVTVPYISLLANKSGETVRKWARDGLMPRPIKVGRDLTWRKVEIDEWMASGCPRSTAVA